jgi:hypothetical protein
MKKSIDATVRALCGYATTDLQTRRLLKKQLCQDVCIETVITTLFTTDKQRDEYVTLFEVVSPKDLSRIVWESSTIDELTDVVEYHVDSVDILKNLTENQLVYMTKLLYNLVKIIHKFKFVPRIPKKIARSPPPPRSKK